MKTACSKCGKLKGANTSINVTADTTASLRYGTTFQTLTCISNSHVLRRYVDIDERTGLCKYAGLSVGCHYEFVEWVMGGSKNGVLEVAKDRWEECRGKPMVTNI